ncbi:phenylacetic acid degradation operon negative regulatory protein [Catenuloplanes nepalensis]|uniref:Phenylacetic acid degradation operon negative regulatory protein n=1 Tax=Catenuloplanes nepalensis TaxID=587533 RepID=A0ABT9MPB2_9ACTN|nr:PaaX family transcriptional regulator C-terminal domain-containing protein [Catenuloplanes nepalensis]MDP9793274.1 phenylacetic acid degradation operon negative regulatory protein [Catenuloplanes nepalensis]
MGSPYDIEEIFPGDAVGAVRMPRRQTGNSPQGLAVTLLADYTLRARAWLPSAAIVALLGEADVSPAGARTAISRLARRGVLESHRQGRHSSYRLTAAAAGFLAVGGREIVSPVVEPWDDHWTLIAFSLPQAETTRRRGLRAQLRWMGFAPLYDGLWISPRALGDRARAELAEVAHGAMTVFRARHVDVAATAARAPIDAWDTAAIAAEYDAFIRRWRATPARMPVGAAAVRVRTEVMDDYRRLPILDPALPARLLPPGWRREPARELFAAVYDGLARAAEEHVRTVAGPLARDVRAHTVAELVAGLTA